MKNEHLLITKASGEKVPFSIDKLKTSLQRSGASVENIEFIMKRIQQQLYQNISTKKIYKLAFALLKKQSKPSAARYKLKNAIMELGPSGFPFEIYFAEILSHRGYHTKVGEFVEGRCVRHEIDVLAEKDKKYIMIECKYHNLQGISCDVKIPLYIHSRFLDVVHSWKKLPGHDTLIHEGWVVTNTKFTSDAIQYGICAGLELIGWNYPLKNNLKTMIDESGLYPITCLNSISKGEKQLLLNKGIVLCVMLLRQSGLLKLAHINESRFSNIMAEVQSLCQHI